MSVVQVDPGRSRLSAVTQVVWRSLQVSATILLVVVPFGYSVTADHQSVLMAAGAGFAVGVGLNLRMGARGGRPAGMLIGSGIGVIVALLAGLLPSRLGFLFVAAPTLPLAVGLCDGLGSSRIRGYREATLETLTIAVLLGLAAPVPAGAGVVVTLFCVPTTALIAGYFNHDLQGRRYARPPWLLIIGSLAAMVTGVVVGSLEGTDMVAGIILAPVMLLMVPVATFLSARGLALWLQPRLRVYLQLVDYLRVMWVPIGGFAAGYVAIILVFAGFCGMLERFYPGSFAVATDAGIGDWISFSFFSALAEEYTGITPVSTVARMLVGLRLVVSVGWALVVFAAVMSAVQPQLDRIARRNAQQDAD